MSEGETGQVRLLECITPYFIKIYFQCLHFTSDKICCGFQHSIVYLVVEPVTILQLDRKNIKNRAGSGEY